MKLIKTLIAIAAIGVGSQAFGKTKTATLKAYGLQFSLTPMTTSNGSTLYFTTYDGGNGYPLNDQNTVSGELKPSYVGRSVFRADYLAATASSSGVIEHGTISLNMPTADTDGNGVHDWLQKDMAVNAAITGSSAVHWLAPGWQSGNSSITGRINRSAGSSSGTLSVTYTITGLGTSTATGTWYVGYWGGTVTYDGDKYGIDITTLDSTGETLNLSGSAGYSNPSENQLQFGDIQLTDGSDVLRIVGSTLNRSGNSYTANMKAVDGNPDTSWGDYIDWHVVVTDINDADSDGVPDFTDTSSQWMWHGAFPWVYSHAESAWWYMKAGTDGKFYAWKQGDQKWYSFDEAGKAWTALPGQADVQEAQQVPTANKAGDTYTVPDLSLEMLWVEPGTFMMGSPESEAGRRSDETQHQVTLTQGFWLGKYEVTQAQWERVMGNNPSESGAMHKEEADGSITRDFSEVKGADRPVETVSWNDVTSFCEKLTELESEAGRLPAGMAYQLPTEAQWEYACRAGTTTAYSWGDTIATTNANFSISGISKTRDVGQYAANPWGFFDMHGNVHEWVADWKANYPGGAVTDPVGPVSASRLALRGGGWGAPAYRTRSAERGIGAPYSTGWALGFRLSLRPASK
jgi:formylglycine-generating enzyme required for sulfatase activity